MRFRPATFLPRHPTAAVVIGLSAIALVLLYLNSALPGSEIPSRVENNARELAALDARLNQDLVLLRYGRLSHYDSLAGASQRIAQLLDDGGNALATYAPARTRWREAEGAFREKTRQMDDAQRHMAVLRNSQYHFINLVREQRGRAARARDRESGARLLELERAMLALMLNQSAADDTAIRGQLAGLAASAAAPGAQARKLELLDVHARRILEFLPVLERRIDSALAVPWIGAVNEASTLLVQSHAERTRYAGRYRTLLAVLSLALLAYLVIVLTHLDRTAHALQRNLAFVTGLTDTAAEGIFATDAHGRFTFVNREGARIIGRDETELSGATLDGVFGRLDDAPRASDPAAANPIRDAVARLAVYRGEHAIRRGDGARPVSLTVAPLGAEAADGMVGVFSDISERRHAEERLRVAARAFDSLSEAMMVTDAAGVIRWINPAFTAVTGFTEAEALSRAPGELLKSGQQGRDFYAAMWRALREEGCWQGEIVNRRKNGESYPEWLSISAVRNPAGITERYVALFADLTERKNAETYIQHLAYHDVLTGLPNRLLLHDRMNNALARARRSGRPLAVLILNLNRLKSVNDSLGHEAGDAVLRETARRLSGCLREGDTLGRLGGDDFVALLPDIAEPGDAERAAQRFLGAFNDLFAVDDRELYVTASVGIALHPGDGGNPEALLKNADVAMYAAKESGHNAYRYYVSSLNARSLERLELESQLRRAVERDELELHYQPLFNIASGAISGVEALVRWRHPRRGLLPPAEFVPLAESSGLIIEVGAWVLGAACTQLRAWQDAGLPLPRVSVNVSAVQVKQPDFPASIALALRNSRLDPACLDLELTETVLAGDRERIHEIFSALKQSGVCISIDDFGTGYSSLSYLHHYPVDKLKIDQSFVRRLPDDRDAQAIVRAMIVLGHGLHLDVVAEGVEHDAQRSFLDANACDEMQGHLFTPPLPAGEFLAFARERDARPRPESRGRLETAAMPLP